MSAHLELQNWWSVTSADIVTMPTPPSQVQELENRYNVSLPDDFKDYLLAACPVGEDWDKENTAWWQFDRIRNIPEEYQHELSSPEIAARRGEYLFFADHCIWCWAWAISCTNDENRGKVAMIGGMPDRFVANSFSQFVSRYISDFRSVC